MQSLIQQTNYLTQPQKLLLINNLSNIDSMDVMRLEKALKTENPVFITNVFESISSKVKLSNIGNTELLNQLPQQPLANKPAQATAAPTIIPTTIQTPTPSPEPITTAQTPIAQATPATTPKQVALTPSQLDRLKKLKLSKLKHKFTKPQQALTPNFEIAPVTAPEARQPVTPLENSQKPNTEAEALRQTPQAAPQSIEQAAEPALPRQFKQAKPKYVDNTKALEQKLSTISTQPEKRSQEQVQVLPEQSKTQPIQANTNMPPEAETTTLNNQAVDETFNYQTAEVRVQNPIQARPDTQLELPKAVTHTSLIDNIDYLGHKLPRIDINWDNIQRPQDIDEITSVDQIFRLDKRHISFVPGDNIEQKFKKFIKIFSKQLDAIDDISQRRSVYVSFMQSPLYSAYIKTGLTALSHTKDNPKEAILNLLHQADETFLSNKEFQYAALLVNEIKSQCGF